MICLYFGRAGECLNCGGYIRAKGCQPTEGEHGVIYCSADCAEEAAWFAARATREAASDWCPRCGYDNHEHGPPCEEIRAGAPA